MFISKCKEQTIPFIFVKQITFFLLLAFTALMITENTLRVSILHHQFAIVSIFAVALFIAWFIKTILFGCQIASQFIYLTFVLGWFAFSTVWSVAPSTTILSFSVFASVCLFAVIFYDLIDNHQDLMLCWQLFVFGALIASIVLLNQSIHHQFIYYDDRASAFGYNPNDIAYIFVLPIVFISYIIDNSKNKIILYVNLLYIWFASVSIILTGSRTSIICLIAALIYLMYHYRRPLTKLKSVVTLLLIIGISGFFIMKYTSLATADIYHVTYQPVKTSDATAMVSNSPAPTFEQAVYKPSFSNGRTAVWLAGFKAAKQHFLIGTGFNTFANEMEDVNGLYISAHNIFLQLWVETGVIGLGLFLIWYLQLGLASLTSAPKQMLVTMFLIVTIVASLNNILLMKQTWFFFATILVLNNLAKTKTKDTDD